MKSHLLIPLSYTSHQLLCATWHFGVDQEDLNTRHTGGEDKTRHTGGEDKTRHAGGEDKTRHTGREDKTRHTGGEDKIHNINSKGKVAPFPGLPTVWFFSGKTSKQGSRFSL